MTFPKYEAYRPFEASWISQIPKHWESTSLKRIASLRSGDSITSDSIQDEGEYHVFGGNGVRGFTSSFTHSGNHPIIGRQGALCGNINYAEGRFWASEHAVVASPEKEVSIRWLGETLRAMNLNQYSVSAAQPGLSVETISNLLTPYPPIEEQLAIASFLDRETAKIDALIAEQQRLIELLQEKRQAVISHSVTKGLYPNAPMKDSGVDWLGEVPEHWDVVQIKWLSPVKRGASPRPIEDPKYFDDCGEYAWVRISDVTSSNGRLEATSQRLSELGSSLSVKLKPGSLFVSIAGSVGKTCITRIKACIHDGFVYFPDLRVSPEFLELIFVSGECFGGLGKLGTQLNLNTDTIGAIRIGVPRDNKEVDAIVQYCMQESERLGELEAAALGAVSLLSERRSALISAAVTGQIDVRGLATEEEP